MASSQKQFATDSKDTKVTEEKTAPVDVMNIMLEYDDFDNVIGHGLVPLVSTLFNSIKSQKSMRLKNLLTAIVIGNFNETKAILEKDPSLLEEKLEEKGYVIALSGQRSNNVTAYRELMVSDTFSPYQIFITPPLNY